MSYHARTQDSITPSEKAHSEAVRKLAGECAVILENNGILPVENPSSVALFGNGARHTIKGGTGSGDVNSRYVVNIEQGLEEAGFSITTDNWLSKFDDSFDAHIKEYMAEVDRRVKATGMHPAMVMFELVPGVASIPKITEEDAEGADTAIYVLSRDSGEGGDRTAAKGDFYLADDEVAAFDFMTSHFKNTILVLNTGGIVSLEGFKDKFSAIIQLSQLGNLTGNIAADVITGKADPSGRLTDTWCFDFGKYPNGENFSHNNGDTNDEYYKEGSYIGYRYFDSFAVKPDYPFGYGLGFTTFKIEPVSVEVDGLEVVVEYKVTNTGARAGKEVLQLYVASPHVKLDKPFKELVAFAKSDSIEPGASGSIKLSFSLAQIASYCTKCECKVLEPGDYILLAGKNASDVAPIARFTVNERIATEHLRNMFGDSGIEDEYTNPGIVPAPDASGVKVFVIDASGVVTREPDYIDSREELVDLRQTETIRFEDVVAGKASVEELTAQLSVEEMARLCVGDYGADMIQSANIVGSASKQVPGAAAETITTYLKSRGIPSMILADGPAGLRLQPHFKTTKDGELIPGGEVFGLSYNPFPEDTPSDAVDYYQYCTAIPIATALAQSFNMDLIKTMGTIVGEEMKEYFVHFWLAPGMNIHRNPLCGRNFEYYSEDPLISGKCAAAMTDGVQALGGQGTTIKHFCCNNQEVNRMFSNSHVSERTIRNLYLRGFEIAVRESQPYSVMSSYNLLNGTHTANHVGLCRNVLRDEWGFEGVVMTDWYTSQENQFGDYVKAVYPISSSVECIRSGNDWQMPGCEPNVTDIINAVAEGTLPKADLQFCTANILKMAVKCFSDG
ncbi:MAG: glycoside hydrolase family 3 C-terminal domain-containing protein [Clostridiales bacterium]|nr:glycoside hydrolase family 3 C-terminal domain-containing protein [Clostridiales bacterium]